MRVVGSGGVRYSEYITSNSSGLSVCLTKQKNRTTRKDKIKSQGCSHFALKTTTGPKSCQDKNWLVVEPSQLKHMFVKWEPSPRVKMKTYLIPPPRENIGFTSKNLRFILHQGF